MTLGLINRGEGERKNESERERKKREKERERWLKNQTQSISYRPAARLK